MKTALSVVNIFLGLTLFAWPFALFGTLFMFDAPGSESSPITVSLAIAILCYPLPIVIGNLGFWFFNKVASRTRMVVYTFIGLLSPLAVSLLFWALDVFCGGQFSCR